MRIISLLAENVKRLHAIEITPKGNFVVIGGQNAAGKSSVLDAIEMALAGKGSACPEPVRRGAEKARIVCRLDDIVVTRTFTAGGGGTLTVSDASGKARYASPQKLLDALVGRLTFDPLAFSQMKPQDQLRTLRELVGVDFTILDDRRRALYEERTTVNRQQRDYEAQAAGIPEPAPDLPAAEQSIEGLSQELNRIEAHNSLLAEKEREAERVHRRLTQAQQFVEELRTRLVQVEKELADLQEQARAVDKQVSSMEREDKAPVLEAMKQLERTNTLVRQQRDKKAYAERAAVCQQKEQELTAAIAQLDEQKRTTIAAAKFPVEGLAFGEAGVTFQGLPFEQASASEQLRVSVAMGIAMNPKLKILLIRDGSLLDERNLALVAKMAADADAQVWMERVGEGQESQVVIEDGRVKGAPAPKVGATGEAMKEVAGTELFGEAPASRRAK
jgi:hypothetical protein